MDHGKKYCLAITFHSGDSHNITCCPAQNIFADNTNHLLNVFHPKVLHKYVPVNNTTLYCIKNEVLCY